MTTDLALPKAALFANLGLPPHLVEAVARLGFATPTEIQAAAIPTLMAGRDIVGVAQTGTGKTAAFGLPMLAAIDPHSTATQGLVLAPTRELALQVAGAIEGFAATMPQVTRVTAVYGGAPFTPQKRALQAGSQIVVGTPGRIIDHLERGTLNLDQVRFVVLDEGDEMLRMGFAEEVDTILLRVPDERQTALFSATMPAGIRATAKRHLRNPAELSVTRQASTVAGVTQRYAVVPYRHKTGALARLLATTSAQATIVFVKTRAAAEEVGQALVERGFNCATISGDVPQRERERIVERLRDGQLDILVATDVAARGLDIDRVGLVVNFDIPRDAEGYVHRIGRTGRAGRTGMAFSFINPGEQRRLRQIEQTIRLDITEYPVPSPAQVSKHKLAALLERVPARLEAGRLALAREAVTTALDAGLDPVDLATALAAMAVGDTGPNRQVDDDEAYERERLHRRNTELTELQRRGYGTDRSDSHARTTKHEDHRRDRDARAGRAGRDDHTGRNTRPSFNKGQRYWIGVGHGTGAQAGAIVGALTGDGNLRSQDLGRIDIFKSYSLVEIAQTLSAGTMRRLANTQVAGKALRIKPDKSSGQFDSPGPRSRRYPKR
jgi:ATP-dependent RNA helicase DeaD